VVDGAGGVALFVHADRGQAAVSALLEDEHGLLDPVERGPGEGHTRGDDQPVGLAVDERLQQPLLRRPIAVRTGGQRQIALVRERPLDRLGQRAVERVARFGVSSPIVWVLPPRSALAIAFGR
jgi:hypothetical protein